MPDWRLELKGENLLIAEKTGDTFAFTKQKGTLMECTITGTRAEILDLIKSSRTVWANYVRRILDAMPA